MNPFFLSFHPFSQFRIILTPVTFVGILGMKQNWGYTYKILFTYSVPNFGDCGYYDFKYLAMPYFARFLILIHYAIAITLTAIESTGRSYQMLTSDPAAQSLVSQETSQKSQS